MSQSDRDEQWSAATEHDAEHTQPMAAVDPEEHLEADADPTDPDPEAEASPVGGAAAAGATAAAAAAPEPGRGNRRLLTWLLAALAVLALIAGLVWIVTTTAAANRQRSLTETASAYLNAVAAADAEGALSHLAERPANTSLITDPVLQSSREQAPLREITVGTPEGEGREATVPVTYTLGSQPVQAQLRLVGDGRTSWKIADGTADLAVPAVAGTTVNGAVPEQETNPVLPGSYTLTAASDLVEFQGQPTVLVTAPDAEAPTFGVTATLSDTGRQRVEETVRRRLDECLAATESQPANCPFGVDTAGVEVAPGSVRFQLTNDPWAGFAPQLDPATMNATGTLHLEITAEADVTMNGQTLRAVSPQKADRTYTVDLSAEQPSVTWS